MVCVHVLQKLHNPKTLVYLCQSIDLILFAVWALIDYLIRHIIFAVYMIIMIISHQQSDKVCFF